MTGIQVLLVLAALVWIASFLARFRSAGAVRIVAVAAALGAIALVLAPNLSIWLARKMGVARGVDLVIYLGFAAMGFVWLHLAARQRELEAKLDQLVRSKALDEAVEQEGDERGP